MSDFLPIDVIEEVREMLDEAEEAFRQDERKRGADILTKSAGKLHICAIYQYLGADVLVQRDPS